LYPDAHSDGNQRLTGPRQRLDTSRNQSEPQAMNAGALIDDAARPAERARSVASVLAANSAAIETGRALTPEVLDALHGARLFRTLLPRRFGGEEVRPADFVLMMIDIAREDASTAWCIGQGSGCSMAAAYLTPEIAAEIWGSDPHAVLAWGMGPGSIARVVDGGYRVTGRWQFASGGKHATWLGGHCWMEERDGSFRAGPDGGRLERTMLFPQTAASFTDAWQVMGLRGTGSDTYAVTDLFVADDYTVCRDTDAERRETGALYQFTTTHLYASAFASVALGIARGMLDAFVGLARSKTPTASGRALRDSPTVQRDLALAEGKWRAARAGLMTTLGETWDAVAASGTMTLDQKIDIRLATTFAIHQAKEVVDICWREAGATAIFESNPFERRFRDMHAVTQQVQGRMTHLEAVGLHLLGGVPNGRFI
jgi:alkylation response protein AidB-like acyl-CoA dehydrogenase